MYCQIILGPLLKSKLLTLNNPSNFKVKSSIHYSRELKLNHSKKTFKSKTKDSLNQTESSLMMSVFMPFQFLLY